MRFTNDETQAPRQEGRAPHFTTEFVHVRLTWEFRRQVLIGASLVGLING